VTNEQITEIDALSVEVFAAWGVYKALMHTEYSLDYDTSLSEAKKRDRAFAAYLLAQRRLVAYVNRIRVDSPLP